MALKGPLTYSNGSLHFRFSTLAEMSASPDTGGLRSPLRVVSSPPPATDSATLRSLRPSSVKRVSSYSMHIPSSSDIVGPSPVTSNGTDITEIEDDVSEEEEQAHCLDSLPPSGLLMLTTTLPENVRQANNEEAVSVIHAPESFASWTSTGSTAQQSEPSERSFANADGMSVSDIDEAVLQKAMSHPSRPPISTDVKPVRYSIESATPRAQDLQVLLNDGSRLRSSSASSLEKIDEQAEGDDDGGGSGMPFLQSADDNKVATLRTALHDCWTLCNTLASLSAIHRTRMFNSSGTPDARGKAWKTCWKLCQRLHANQHEDPASPSVRDNLDLCRDFCQALFDIRQKKNETADSVLRVSFELSNHLYSAQDSRNLPELFRERTLDFYITLCHRLMKQRSELAEETDHLLGACWTLAEMLFSLRQNRRGGKPQDEELLLGSAVQACWDLCDMFRDGWTQIRPDRNTPRPSQMSVFLPSQPIDQSGRESRQSNHSSPHSKRDSAKSSRQEERPPVPETPVTEFEDTPISPASRSPQVPKTMVLGTTSSGGGGRGGRWSSNASSMSSYSRGSSRTSSTATTGAAKEDANMSRSKALILRAAMNAGFNRDTLADPKAEPATLQKFVQGLPAGSFGSLPSHATLLQQYASSVLDDDLGIVAGTHLLPARGKRVTAPDMARSVAAVSNSSPRHAYLRDLFKLVFQFSMDEADARRNVSIVV